MSIFMICGMDDCPNFTHARRAAEHLHKYLPKFTYLLLKKTSADWRLWLADLNDTNEWYLTTSPVIWKCITRTGGKPHLIGGLSEFWEYVYDYYGFQSFMSRSDLTDLMADNLAGLKSDKEKEVKVIGISGAAHPMIPLLIYDLEQALSSTEQNRELEIRLYQDDRGMEDCEDFVDGILDVIQEFADITKNDPTKINIVLSSEELITGCDLLIILDEYSRYQTEDLDEWLSRCHLFVSFWADDLNSYAKRNTKVIFCQDSAACFNATVLMHSCTSIPPGNIVAVTAAEGIAMIDTVSRKSQVPVREMGCPPVWGIPGIASFVDVESTVTKASVFRPFGRATVSKDGTKLPKGHVYEELRFMSYVLTKHDAEDVRREAADRKEKEAEILERTPFLPKVRAIGSLLKLWLAKNPDDDIISLGVCSDGSFGFPQGVVISQPAKLDARGTWVPFSNFPLSETAKIHIQEVLTKCNESIEQFCVKEPTEDGDSVHSFGLSKFRM